VLDEAVVSTTVTVDLITVIARLFAKDDTVATHSEALAVCQAIPPWLDFTRLRTAILVPNVAVITLLTRYLDAISANTNAHTTWPRAILATNPAVLH
jgi:hypothetical protein